MISPIIEEILRTGRVQDDSGNYHKLNSNIDSYEGNLLFNLIQSDSTIVKTLEIGCAYGLSSLYICSALASREHVKHVIIDPFQTVEWHDVGVSNLKRAGFDFFELIEKPSEFALPELANAQEGLFDLVFIDGWHTFDHTLVDFFYANRLVRQGGYVVLDDCNMPSVSKVVSYFKKYPCYQLQDNFALGGRNSSIKPSLKRRLGTMLKNIITPEIAGYCIPKYLYDKYYERLFYPGMVVFKKIDKDVRSWDWYRVF